METPEKDIMVEPKWSILEDGRGYQVLSVGGLPFVDKDGRRCIRFKIKPDDIVKKRYNLALGKELDEMGNMFFAVLESDLIPLNVYDDANKKWIYVKSFKHEQTDLSDREDFLKRKLAFAERRILLLEGQIIKLSEQLELAKLETGKYVSQASEVFEKSAGAIAQAIRKSDDEKK